jgi:hypothetical protein
MSAIIDPIKSVFGLETSAEKAASGAAGVQERAAQAGIAETRRQFDITTGQLTEAEQLNRQLLEEGRISSIEALERGGREQAAQLSPFAEAGVSALGRQQALLGLGTPEEQEAAFASFSESPGQRFIRERAERSVTRNASTIGGVGGGNVRAALTELGAGFAAQDFSNQFNRLGQIRTSGQQAAGDIGSGRLSTGQNIASTQFGARQLTGASAINTAARQGQFGQQAASNISNLTQSGSQARASGILGSQQAKQEGQQQSLEIAAALFSDKRLKENIKKIGTLNGFGWYSWTWNKLALKLGLEGNSTGVIADKVKLIRPGLIGEREGFLTVNYSGLVG